MRHLYLLPSLLSTALSFSLVAPFVRAESPGSAEDRAAILAVVKRQADAWNRGDAEGFAADYAEDGTFTNILGMQLQGKPAFVEQHARIFSTIYKGSHNALTATEIKFLRPDVAVVDIDGVLSGMQHVPPGVPTAPDGSLHVKLQEVMSKEKGRWVIAAFHNVVVAPLGARP